MEIIKMVIEDKGSETTELVYGPGIQIFSSEGGTKMDPYEAGKLIDKLVNDYLFDHPEVSYQDALKKILDKHPDLKSAYARGVPFLNHDCPTDSQKLPDQNQKRPMEFYVEEEHKDVRAEVDKRTKARMAKNSSLDYEAAMNEVFEADPKLKEDYAKS